MDDAKQDDQVEQIARVCHAALSAYRESLGQDPLPAWDAAPEWQRRSSREAVRFRLTHPDAPADAQHEQWRRDRLADGWRHGPVRDEAAKTNPMLVPYAELPDAERRKDLLVMAVVRSLGGPLA